MECSTEKIEVLVEKLARALADEVGDAEGTNLLEWEGRLCEVMQAVGQKTLQALLEGKEGRYPASAVACSCGEVAHYRYRRQGTLLTHFGRVRYRRRYYVCDSCHRGQYPLDQTLQIEPGQVSARLSSELAMLGVTTAFGEAAKLVKALLMVDVSPTTVQQATQRFGLAQQRQEAEWHAAATDVAYLERSPPASRPQRLYGSLDGVIVPVEEEWRELKVGCWYQVHPAPLAPPRDAAPESQPLRAEPIRYFCDFADADEFGQQLWAAGCATDADQAQELVFVADGAAWIWRLVEEYFPNAVQIVDWYHAVAYLTPIAHAAFGAKHPQGQAWLTRMRKLLWHGRLERLRQECIRLQKRMPAAAESIKKALTYYANNAHRMDYASFRQAGYFIGSGTVESACKQIGTYRLKRTGACWSRLGAQLVAKARAAWLSGDWPQLIAQSVTT